MSQPRFQAAPRSAIQRFPFSHIVIDDFLPARAHARLCARLDTLVQQGLIEHRDLSHLAKMPGYDCYTWVFPPDAAAPLNVFTSRAFLDYAADLFEIELSGEVSAQFNYHPAGARNGLWHTDFNVAYHTLDQQRPDGTTVWYYGCNILDGTVTGGSAGPAVPRVRALAFLYYPGGAEPLQPDDGGATELGYEGPRTGGVATFAAVAPVANRLLMFECSPLSFHRAAANRRVPRAAVVGWFHMTEEAARQRHRAAPEYWSADAVKGRFDYNEASSAKAVQVESPRGA